jgi:hypothetical protein
MKLNFTITEWVKNERVAFTMIFGNSVKSYFQSWVVETNLSGCRFTFMEEVRLPYGVFGKILVFPGQHDSVTTEAKMLLKLKNLAEAS